MDHFPPTPLAPRTGRALVLGLPLAGLLAVALSLALPAGVAVAGTVTVQPGQSLSQVAAQLGTTTAALAAANGISNPNLVDAGTVLQVPGTSAPATAAAPAAASRVTVTAGQTLSGIAAQYGISINALAAANGISNPDLVAAGTVLQIPGAGGAAPAPASSFTTVEVQPGETLTALAAKYGTTIAALVAANKIGNPNLVEAGTVLQLPHPVTSPAPATAAVATVGNVTVRPGDTLTSLAAHYGTTPAALAAANGISNPNVVFAGMVLKLPAETAVGGGSANQPVATGSYPTALVEAPGRLALQPDFVHSASASGVPLSLLEALCWWESGWQTTAVSATGAIGVCQILPSTAAFVSSSILQVAPLDPRVALENIELAAAYLRYLLNTTGGNASQALAGYTQGLTSIATSGLQPATKTYVTGILAYAAIFAGQG